MWKFKKPAVGRFSLASRRTARPRWSTEWWKSWLEVTWEWYVFLFVRVTASSRWRIYTRYVRSVRQQASWMLGSGVSKKKKKKKCWTHWEKEQKKNSCPPLTQPGRALSLQRPSHLQPSLLLLSFPQEGRAVICPEASADHHPSVHPPSSGPFSVLIKAQDLRHQHHSNRVFVWLEGTWLHTHFFFFPLLIPFLHCELCKSFFFFLRLSLSSSWRRPYRSTLQAANYNQHLRLIAMIWQRGAAKSALGVNLCDVLI